MMGAYLNCFITFAVISSFWLLFDQSKGGQKNSYRKEICKIYFHEETYGKNPINDLSSTLNHQKEVRGIK